MNKSVTRIQEILKKRSPDLSKQLEGVTDIMEKSWPWRREIADQLGLELMEFGLNQDEEPNSYGLELESLIDSCKLGSK